MNDDQESRGQTAQPLKTFTQTTKTPGHKAPASPVGWKESFESWFRKLTCPNCYNERRMDLVLDIRDVGGYNMPFYTCKQCRCQFTRKPRYENVYDNQERI